MRKVIIVGSGPAGYAAAVYTARAELKPLIMAGDQPGGQLTQTTEVENYPGFPKGIQGPELMERMRQQAVRFGAEMVYEVAKSLEKTERGFRVKGEGGKEYEGASVILALGAKPRMLGIGEERLVGRGVSTCAVCDAAFFKDKTTYVVGGGDVAVEDALALAKFARQVTLVVRRDQLRASKAMVRRLQNNQDKVDIMWQSRVVGVKGESRLEKIVVEVKGKGVKEMKADGLFLAIGHVPDTEWVRASGIEVDEKGYVNIGLTVNQQGKKVWLEGYPTMTNVEGVFAAGDVVDFRYRQAITAAGMGVMAALDVEKWLNQQN